MRESTSFGNKVGRPENDFCLNMAGEKGKRRKRRPKGKPDNPAQSARFIKAAKALRVDESGEAFKQALDKLVPKKPKGGSS